MKNQKIQTKNENAKSKSKGNGPAHVTDATFDSIIAKNPVVLIDFWADWCGPCKALAPTIEKLAKEYSGKVFVGKLDVDENRIISNRFKVSSIPTVIIFKNGKKAARIVGYVPKEEIDSALKKTLERIEEEPGKRRDKA